MLNDNLSMTFYDMSHFTRSNGKKTDIVQHIVQCTTTLFDICKSVCPALALKIIVNSFEWVFWEILVKSQGRRVGPVMSPDFGPQATLPSHCTATTSTAQYLHFTVQGKNS